VCRNLHTSPLPSQIERYLSRQLSIVPDGTFRRLLGFLNRITQIEDLNIVHDCVLLE